MGYYICAGITLLSALLGVGFSVAAIMNERNTSRINDFYMFARSLALACIAVIPLCMVSPKLLFVITAAMLVVQIVDGIVGIVMKSKKRTSGPILMATQRDTP